MSKGFDAAFFKANREHLRSLFSGTAPIILTANGLVQSTADMTFPFRQDRNFWYLSGINEADIILVMDKTKEYLILPEREQVQELFSGALSSEYLAKLSGVETVLNHKEGWKALGSRLKKVKHMATLAPLPKFISVHGMYTNPARAQLIEQAKAVNPKLELLDLRQHLATLRMVKQPVELEAIQTAIRTTEKSITTVLLKKSLRAGVAERDLENDLGHAFRKYGADGPAFETIVAAGENSCVIHHVPGPTLLPASGGLLIDAGAEVDFYAADISRTFSLGRPSKRFTQVYEAALDAQTYARSVLKPGVIIRDYEKEVERYMGEKLRELGLIKSIDRDSVRHYFPTAASHHLGLDAHDAANYDAPLLPGMVLAVEPGIYVPEEGIGIRVEDNVVITETGHKVLTAGLSRELTTLTIK